jgi:hypothetical protein
MLSAYTTGKGANKDRLISPDRQHLRSVRFIFSQYFLNGCLRNARSGGNWLFPVPGVGQRRHAEASGFCGMPKPVADGSVAGIVDRAINHPSWGQFGDRKNNGYLVIILQIQS